VYTYLAGVTSLNEDACLEALLGLQQVLVHSSSDEQ
jgi:hypothetical protein